MKRFLRLIPLFAGCCALSAATPSVRFSTYLGGSGTDIPTAMAVANDGSIYVTGITGSADFPEGQMLADSGTGAFVAKMSSDGSHLAYSTLLGGIFPRAIAVDASGNVYVAGHDFYDRFPLKNGQPLHGGVDAALIKIDATGTNVLFATFIGGSGDDAALALAVDGSTIWIAGVTTSTNFPIVPGALQTNLLGPSAGFLMRMSQDGPTGLFYSSYLGGAGGSSLIRAITLDSDGRPVVVGRTSAPDFPVKNAFQPTKGEVTDAFVAKFSPSIGNLIFSTFIGGDQTDSAASVGLDANNNIYIMGTTRSSNFPLRNAFQTTLAGEDEMFVISLDSSATQLRYSTLLGSSFADSYRGYPFSVFDSGIPLEMGGIAVAPDGRALVVNTTSGNDFPLVNSIKPKNDAYSYDCSATLFSPLGDVTFSSYIGGLGGDLGYATAPTPDGGFAILGAASPGTLQPDFAATPGAYQTRNENLDLDGFVMKLDTNAPPLTNDAFANAASIFSESITLLGQNAAATKQAGEPNHEGNAGGHSVWYHWSAPMSGRAIVSTDGSNFPTLLGIYQTGGGLQWTPVTLDGPVDHGTYNEAKFSVISDQDYYIAVDGRDGATGTFAMSITISLPPNDDFANRAPIIGATATVTGSNVGATGERGDAGRNSVWWKWTAPTTGDYTINTIGSDFNTAFTMFTGSALGSLNRVAIGAYYTNELGRTTMRAQTGVEYQIVVVGEESQTGNIQLNIAPAIRPPNDDFAARTKLSGRNVTVTGNDFDATYDPTEYNLALLAELPIYTGRIVWWEWTAPIDGAAQFNVSATRIAFNDEAGTGILVFAGDTFPTDKTLITTGVNTTGAASAYVTEVHAGVHYQIGLDAIDYEQPVNFTLTIRAIAPPRIIPASVQISSGALHATVEGIEGHNYRVTASTNLRDWTGVGDFPAITGQFSFESPTSAGYQFYRVEEF